MLDSTPTTTLTCQHCQGAYTKRAASVRAYVKFFGVERKYCSRKCNFPAKRAAWDARPAPTFACGHCAKVQPYPLRTDNRGYIFKQRYCDQICATAARKKSHHLPHKVRDRNGYIEVYSGGRGGKYRPEHRIIMESIVGRPLRKEETVHHKNGQRDDNRPENLELWSSRHGKGQRVSDKVQFCVEFLSDYGFNPQVPSMSEYISAISGLV